MIDLVALLGRETKPKTYYVKTDRKSCSSCDRVKMDWALDQQDLCSRCRKTYAQQTGTVYFIYSPALNRIKIGRSTHPDPKYRFSTIKVCSADPDTELLGYLSTSDVRILERRLHRHFAPAKSHGEWYHATPELREFIQVQVLL